MFKPRALVSIMILLSATTSSAGVRAFVGSMLHSQSVQEQVVEARVHSNLSLGYQWNQWGIDLNWSSIDSESGNSALQIDSKRSDSMLWSKYFTDHSSQAPFRAFVAAGIGITQTSVATRIEGHRQTINGEPFWVTGVGFGAEWSPLTHPFTIASSVGVRSGEELSPSPSYHWLLQMGLTF